MGGRFGSRRESRADKYAIFNCLRNYCHPSPTPRMSNNKSLLIIGSLPDSNLLDLIKQNCSITHISTETMSRAKAISTISSLPKKSYTCVILLADTMHLNPFDRTLFSPLKIELFCKVGAGYDAIDVEYFTSQGTWVANAPKAVRVATAEWCVSLILATVKGLGLADCRVRKGRWSDTLGLQSNIQGMTLGIVGLGGVGKVHNVRFSFSNSQEVVKRMQGWGIKIIYSNRRPLPIEEETQLGVEFVSFPTLLAQSNIISLHCPLTDDTYHLLNSETLSQCKRGVFIINASRGCVVDESALLRALDSGQVSRVGLDVFEHEPYLDGPLLGNENVVLSPHYASFTHDCCNIVQSRS